MPEVTNLQHQLNNLQMVWKNRLWHDKEKLYSA